MFGEAGKSLVIKIEFIKNLELLPKFYKVWCSHIALSAI